MDTRRQTDDELHIATSETHGKSISYMVFSFMMDLGIPGLIRIAKNGISYENLYKEFLEEHPKVKISFNEFEIHVVESLKRILAGISAEAVGLPISILESILTKVNALSENNLGTGIFIGTLAANFLTFAYAWGRSHSHKFYKDGKFHGRDFAMSLLDEYIAHFGPIAIGFDLLASYLIQVFTDRNMDSIAVSAVISTIGSAVAIFAYFYEQQFRETAMETLKGIARSIHIRAANVYLPG